MPLRATLLVAACGLAGWSWWALRAPVAEAPAEMPMVVAPEAPAEPAVNRRAKAENTEAREGAEVILAQSEGVARPEIVLRAEAGSGPLRIFGLMPRGTLATDLGLAALPETLELAAAPAQARGFLRVSAAGLLALGEMVQGRLEVSDGTLPHLLLAGDVRDPRVSGTIAAMLADLHAEITLDLVPLDDGLPLALSVEKTEQGLLMAGKAPLGSALPAAPGLQRAAIALEPAGFDAAAQVGLAALEPLTRGRLELRGAVLHLAGEATRADLARALAELDALPPGFRATTALVPLDDGLPLGIRAERGGDVISLLGKVPAGTDASALGLEAFEEAVIVSDETANTPGFVQVVQAGLGALAAMEEGLLIVADGEAPGAPAALSLEGGVSRDGLAAMNAALGDLPEGITPVISVVFYDDGAPMLLEASIGPAGIILSGKLPFGATSRALGVEALGPLVRIAEIEARDPDFLEAAAAGLTALAELETGRLIVADAEGGALLSLTGAASTPAKAERARSRLGTGGVHELTTLDDGSPPAFTLRFAAKGGATLNGKLPKGLSSEEIAAALGVTQMSSDAVQGFTGVASTYAPIFPPLAAWLPEVERLEARFDGAGLAQITIVPEPGVDAELLAGGLARDLGVRVALEDAKLPVAGAERISAATGQRERFSGVAWLPVYAFSPSRAACDAQSRAVLAEGELTFVTGASRLDAQAVRAVNKLAGIISHCLAGKPALRIEIGGHTDNAGTEEANLALSTERAEAVLSALTARGVGLGAMVAVGHGVARPVADNATAEGRAANRRTEIEWLEPATP